MRRRRSSQESTHPLADRVAKRLGERCGVQAGSRLLVGVSGGADSVALLRLLLESAQRLDLELQVGHFDHALRENSDQDALFVQELSRSLGLPVHVHRWQHPVPGEEAARRARLEFLQETAVQTGSQALVLAHHLNDQIETVLLRLSRGTGLRGWLGIAWRREEPVPIVRPLLDLRHADLVAYLEEIGQAWREDPTNRDPRSPRNRVRHQVLPALQAALESGWAERWGESLDELREIWDWLHRSSLLLLEQAKRPQPAGSRGFESCNLEVLRRAEEPVRRLALKLWIEPHLESEISRRHLIAVSNLTRNGQSGQEFSLPDGLRLVLEQGRITLLFEAAEGSAALEPETAKPSLEVLPVPGSIAWTETTRGLDHHGPLIMEHGIPAQAEAHLAADGAAPPFAVRHARPGDRVRLLGAPGSRKLHRIFQDYKVPRRLRSHWPVVEDTLGIVWIPGLGVAERGRLRPDTKHALRLQLRSPGGTSNGPDSAPKRPRRE